MAEFTRRNGNRAKLFGGQDKNVLPSTTRDISGEEKRILEEENEEAIDMLGSRVSRMREIAVDIGSEVRDQNRFLDGMENSMQSAKGLVSGATRRVRGIRSSSQGGFLCCFIIFLLIIFFIIYFVIKYTTKI